MKNAATGLSVPGIGVARPVLHNAVVVRWVIPIGVSLAMAASFLDIADLSGTAALALSVLLVAWCARELLDGPVASTVAALAFGVWVRGGEPILRHGFEIAALATFVVGLLRHTWRLERWGLAPFGLLMFGMLAGDLLFDLTGALSRPGSSPGSTPWMLLAIALFGRSARIGASVKEAPESPLNPPATRSSRQLRPQPGASIALAIAAFAVAAALIPVESAVSLPFVLLALLALLGSRNLVVGRLHWLAAGFLAAAALVRLAAWPTQLGKQLNLRPADLLTPGPLDDGALPYPAWIVLVAIFAGAIVVFRSGPARWGFLMTIPATIVAFQLEMQAPGLTALLAIRALWLAAFFLALVPEVARAIKPYPLQAPARRFPAPGSLPASVNRES